MKLDIDLILKYKYIVFNNKNKELLYFIISNYFNLQIKEIEELNIIEKYTIFNKVNKDYAINVSNNYNIKTLLNLNYKVVLLKSNYLQYISDTNSVLIFESIASSIGTISDFLSKLFNTSVIKKYKYTDFNIYKSLNENSIEFMQTVLKLDTNITGNLSNIRKIFFINKRNKYLSLII